MLQQYLLLVPLSETVFLRCANLLGPLCPWVPRSRHRNCLAVTAMKIHTHKLAAVLRMTLSKNPITDVRMFQLFDAGTSH